MSPGLNRYGSALVTIWAFIACCQGSLLAQASSKPAPPANIFRPLQQLPEPAVPSDTLELVTSDAQPVQDVSQRAEVVNLLISAQRHRNVREYAYDLKTSFTAYGSSTSDGGWQLEDTSPRPGVYRWMAQGPSYSVTNLYYNRVLYSSQPANSIPLRLAQVREALFFTQPVLGPRASLRTVTASFNGMELLCALVSHNFMAKGTSGARQWEETEYCLDPKSSNLVTYSPIPGLYILYDYSRALQFHDKLVPGKFTITMAGRTIIEAQTESIADAAANAPGFQPAGLNAIGVGSVMTGPWRFRTVIPSSAASGVQMVVLHGMQSPGSRTVTDVELIASTDASLNDAALNYVASWRGGPMSEDAEPGATPLSHEIFLTLVYAGAQQ